MDDDESMYEHYADPKNRVPAGPGRRRTSQPLSARLPASLSSRLDHRPVSEYAAAGDAVLNFLGRAWIQEGRANAVTIDYEQLAREENLPSEHLQGAVRLMSGQADQAFRQTDAALYLTPAAVRALERDGIRGLIAQYGL